MLSTIVIKIRTLQIKGKWAERCHPLYCNAVRQSTKIQFGNHHWNRGACMRDQFTQFMVSCNKSMKRLYSYESESYSVDWWNPFGYVLLLGNASDLALASMLSKALNYLTQKILGQTFDRVEKTTSLPFSWCNHCIGMDSAACIRWARFSCIRTISRDTDVTCSWNTSSSSLSSSRACNNEWLIRYDSCAMRHVFTQRTPPTNE